MINVLITGASGLVGGCAVRQATEQNDANICVVSRSYSRKVAQVQGVRCLDEIGNVRFDLVVHAAAATPNNAAPEMIMSENIKLDVLLS
jgi:nucleoside-diphosphate-sugar epimerase